MKVADSKKMGSETPNTAFKVLIGPLYLTITLWVKTRRKTNTCP